MTDMETLTGAALAAVRQEYPHQVAIELHEDGDSRPPHELSPSFYGSYDWHSAVHNHWLLVRALDRGIGGDLTAAVTAVLDEHLSPERLAAERAFFASRNGRTSERPYGWAWLLMLDAECRTLAPADPRFARWAQALAPLAGLLSDRLREHFGGGLAFPVHSETHGNTAFCLQLTYRAARRAGDAHKGELAAVARKLFGTGDWVPWNQPPSGNAFLAPALAEAALLADVLPREEFAAWLDRTLPDPVAVDWRPPVFRADGEDPGTVHLEGLLISRAWCLNVITRALPDSHPAFAPLTTAAAAYQAPIAAIDPTAGFHRSHWIPTFLLFLDEA